MPPRFVRTDAPAPSSASVQTSPLLFRGPTTTGLFTCTRMPSTVSKKSMPSLAGSNAAKLSSSITAVGRARPPMPRTVAAGSGLPVERTAIVGPVISVVVRFALDEPPGRNSVTSPDTRTESPTFTVGADEVKTRSPSEVEESASGSGSCM